MVRHATLADLPDLMGLAVVMHDESRFRHLSFSHNKVSQLFRMLMDNPDGCVFVCERNHEVIGAIAGYVSEHWFSSDKAATEFGLFVLPTERGSHAGPVLLRRYVKWAQERGAQDIQAGITVGVTTEQTSQLYERMGFVMSGHVFFLGEQHVHRT